MRSDYQTPSDSVKMMDPFCTEVRELIAAEEAGDDIEIIAKVEDSKQPKSNNFECLYCYEVFTSNEELIPHQRVHRYMNQYICKWCNVQFTLSGWEYHYRKHTNDKRFKCESCNKDFYTLQQLQSHLSHHKYSCTLCDQMFVTVKQIVSHGKLIHNFSIISDVVTPKSGGKRRRNRQKSIKKLAQEATKPEATCEPEKVNRIQNPAKLFEYPKPTKPERILRIESTSKSCEWLKATKLEKVHRIENAPTSFKYPRTGKTHRRIKNTSKSFVCEHCDVKFNKIILLRNHMKKYRFCRPYWCNDCEATFTKKKELEKHVRKHLYKCESCSLNFSCNHNLNTHCYNKHMSSVFDLEPKSEASFQCSYCGMNWSSEEDLRNHIKSSGEDIIICANCFDTFDSEDKFEYHLKEVHRFDSD